MVSFVAPITDSIIHIRRADYLRYFGDHRHSDYSRSLRGYPLHTANYRCNSRVVIHGQLDLRWNCFLGDRNIAIASEEIVQRRNRRGIADSQVYGLGTFPHVRVDSVHPHQTVSRLRETEALH